MIVNFWSVILIASASQCVFLIFLLLVRPHHNKSAHRLILALLAVLLAININNLWYAGRIYYTYPMMSGLGRGLSLLVGPMVFLYTRAITDAKFRFRWLQLLHIIPYLLVQLLLYLQPHPDDINEGIALIDNFMNEGIPATPISLTRFVIYVAHLITYILLSEKVVRNLKQGDQDYLIAGSRRKRWIMQINILLTALTLVLVIAMINAFMYGYHSFTVNFWLTLVYSAFIYLLAYQAVANARELLPDFNKKYNTINLKQDRKAEILPGLLALFEEEKVFLNAELKLADVASRLETPPHVLTSLINTELNKSFFELLNEYRVKEFINRSKDPALSHLSIFGIAQEVGYKSKSTFNMAFKKQTGQTPSEYLKSAD